MDDGITFVVGDATRPEGQGPRVIVHVCNDIGSTIWDTDGMIVRAIHRGQARLVEESRR